MSEGPSESKRVYQCAFCEVALLLLLNAGFAFVRSQIAMHLVRCPERPADVGAENIARVADKAATALMRG